MTNTIIILINIKITNAIICYYFLNTNLLIIDKYYEEQRCSCYRIQK